MKWLRNRWVITAGVLVLLIGGGYFAYPYALLGYFNYCTYKSTTGLPTPDRAELYLLGGLALGEDKGPKDGFPIKGYGDSLSPIIESKTLTIEETERLVALWRSQTFGWEYQALCHDPVYGVRFYSGSRLLFETSICFHCSNFYVEAPPLHASWHGFDTSKPEAKALLDYCNSLIPYDKRKQKKS